MTADEARRIQARLVASLADPARFGPTCTSVRVLETHISYVLLTGEYAYKIKKAVDLGFLDFTTLDARHHYCDQELRLNRRTAPALYLDVVAVTGSADRPVIGGQGAVLEWAVRMHEFPQEALLSCVLARDELTPAHVDRLAATVAQFHAGAPRVDAAARYGSAEDILEIELANFAAIGPLVDNVADRSDLDTLADWTKREHAACGPTLIARRRDGFVRECHGDLHLGNIALLDGEITLFDCIEFNERMRWIDVMSEIAFTTMDLQSRGHPELASRFRNAYLEITGDYAGLAVLRLYLVYRAMVRAKVACLRAAQSVAGTESEAARAECRRYLGLAKSFTRNVPAAVLVTHGLSGCGKTTLTQPLVERIGAVRIRTDVERKRLAGPAAAAAAPGIAAGLYAPAVTRATYDHVLALTRIAVRAGFVTIVDGAFLYRWQRALFAALAAELAVPFVIVAFVARPATLRERIVQRAKLGTDASDADIAVLEHQLQDHEPLSPDEAPFVAPYDAEQPLAAARRPDAWRSVAQRIGVVAADPRQTDAAALR